MPEGSTGDIIYVPILKGRAGELRALFEMKLPTSARLTPLVEVPLIADESDSDDPSVKEIRGDVVKFAADIKKRWDPDRRVIIDAGNVPAFPNSIPTVYLINSFAQDDYTVTPTVRPSDDELIIRGIAESIHEWGLKSACIRLSGDDLDDSDMPLKIAIDKVLAWLSLTPADVDLVLDFGPIMNEQAMSFAARIARLVLGELPYEKEWRTLVSASGAFPPDLSSIQSGVLSEIPRYDASMWCALKERVRGRVPIFGDYGIAYPTQTTGIPFAPAPQLRFTAEAKWLVMKGRLKDRRGAKQFYDICARVAGEGPVDPELSWGDYYVYHAARAARLDDALTKPGNAMIWRAVGTSHHLAYVANRLATVGVP
jgi:Beta protein